MVVLIIILFQIGHIFTFLPPDQKIPTRKFPFTIHKLCLYPPSQFIEIKPSSKLEMHITAFTSSLIVFYLLVCLVFSFNLI